MVKRRWRKTWFIGSIIIVMYYPTITLNRLAAEEKLELNWLRSWMIRDDFSVRWRTFCSTKWLKTKAVTWDRRLGRDRTGEPASPLGSQTHSDSNRDPADLPISEGLQEEVWVWTHPPLSLSDTENCGNNSQCRWFITWPNSLWCFCWPSIIKKWPGNMFLYLPIVYSTLSVLTYFISF